MLVGALIYCGTVPMLIYYGTKFLSPRWIYLCAFLLCGIFSGDPEVVAAGFDYLKAYGIDCLLTCFLFCFIGFYNGLGCTAFVMIQGIAAAFLIRIPVAYIMCRMTGRLFYIGLGIPCSTIFQILACFLYLRKVRR